MLDQTSPSLVGVGLFFRHEKDKDALYVSSIAPGSSAFRSGVIELSDKLKSLNDEQVLSWNLVTLKNKLQGTPGTFVALEFERQSARLPARAASVYRINLMRGSVQFIQYHDEHDAFGPMSVDRIEAECRMLLQHREEEKNLAVNIERCLRDEEVALKKAREEKLRAQETNRRLFQQLSELREQLARIDAGETAHDDAAGPPALGGDGLLDSRA